MKVFNSKTTKEHVEEINDVEKLDSISNEVEQGISSEFMVPVPYRMLQKISRENRILRKYLLNYCRAHNVLGYENHGKDMPFDMSNNLAYDSKNRLISKLTPEEIAENNKPQELASPVKQYSLDELHLLKEAAKAEPKRLSK